MKKLLLITTVLLTFNINAQEIKFGKVSKEELEEKYHPLDSTADAAYLLKKRRTYFRYDTNDGFIIETEYHERIKIYNKKGFDYATKKITYYTPKSGDKERVSSIKSYTFNIEDSKIVKQKLSNKDVFDEQINKYRSQKKITFPNVKTGSVIDLKYTLTSPYWNIKTLNFQYKIPVKNIQYKVEIPEYFTFNKRSKGFYHIPLKESKKSSSFQFTSKSRHGLSRIKPTSYSFTNIKYTSNVSSFNDKNIPALNGNEPYSGYINNYRGGVEFELSRTNFIKIGGSSKNYTKTWEDVCNTIYKSPSFGNELEKNNYFKEDLTKILNPSKNQFEKVALVFQFIKSKVKWNGYYDKFVDQGVKKAYKNGVGNSAEINLMLTSMLRSAGIDSNPVLISTKNNGTPIFPTRKGYNYVISKVNFSDDKFILLDATDSYSFPNILPARTLNWYGREIYKGGYSQQVKLIPSIHSKENNILHIKIDDSGDLNGMYRKTYNNHSAMFYRQKNNYKKEEEIISSIENKYLIEVENFKINNKENLVKPITESLKFTSEDLIENINNKLYFSPLFFLTTNENPFKSEERSFPVDFGMPWQDSFSISITIPENYKVESYPKEIAIGLPENIGVFKYKTTVQENKIKLSSIIKFNANIIAPQYYSTLKDFYKEIVKKQTEKIVLVKK